MIRKISFGIMLVGAAIVGLAGCPSSFFVCEEGPCGADGSTDGISTPDSDPRDVSGDANKPDVDPPPPDCLTPTEPLKNPEKCLVDAFGIFVSPTGDDANDGTKAKPVKTIGKALGTTRSRIVVCEGTYPETIDIQRDVEIYGGISCSFTTAGKPASIESGKPIGLTVSRGTVLLTSLNVTAVSGAAPGESSVGILAASGATLRLVGGAIVAGMGADGAAGDEGSNYNAALLNSDPTIEGRDASGNTPGGTHACAGLCTEAPSVVVEGASGGVGSAPGGGPGGDGKTTVAVPVGMRGKSGAYDNLNGVCGAGFPGNTGDAANGGAGATASGTVEAGIGQRPHLWLST